MTCGYRHHQRQYAKREICTTVLICHIVTQGGAYDGDESTPVGLQGHVICYSEGRFAAAAA